MTGAQNTSHPLALLRLDTSYVERIKELGPIAGDPPQLIVRADQNLVARINQYAILLYDAAEKDRELFNKEVALKMQEHAIKEGTKGFTLGSTITSIALLFSSAPLSWIDYVCYIAAGAIGAGAVGAGRGAGYAYFNYVPNQIDLIDTCRDICTREFMATAVLFIEAQDEERNLKNVHPLTDEQQNQLFWIQKLNKLIQTLIRDLHNSENVDFDEHSIKHLPIQLQKAYK